MQETELALLVDRFMRTIHSGLQARSSDFDRKGVGPGGGIVLMALADAGQISLYALTQSVARDKSQMTRTIRSLEAKGLVARETSSEDARVTLVTLTSEGRQVVAELTSAVAGVVGDILEPISPEERRTLRDLLARVV